MSSRLSKHLFATLQGATEAISREIERKSEKKYIIQERAKFLKFIKKKGETKQVEQISVNIFQK